MRKKLLGLMIGIAAAVAMLSACGGRNSFPTAQLHKPLNSVYYWRTTFKLSDNEQAFLKANNIGRIYLRMFDVVDNEMGDVLPNATISFVSPLPEGVEIVPTVFIENSVVSYISHEELSDIAQKIVTRVSNMCSWNNIDSWHDLQLDCDWSADSRENFFSLCTMVKNLLPEGVLLSSTIRLHQLQQAPPPVDYGVLMVYNTDNFNSYDTENSILTIKTVKIYLQNMSSDFNLPLDNALPLYSWKLVYDKDKNFKQIYRNEDSVKEGDIVKEESVSYDVIMKAKSILSHHLGNVGQSNSMVLYHLDDNCINKYSDEEFKDIYSY